MSFKFQVKNFVWVNGKVQTTIKEFDDEIAALSYARYANLSETTKVYAEDALIYEQRVDPVSTSSYA
jgi:hypothetical protein